MALTHDIDLDADHPAAVALAVSGELQGLRRPSTISASVRSVSRKCRRVVARRK
jgi:hypothetical protein